MSSRYRQTIAVGILPLAGIAVILLAVFSTMLAAPVGAAHPASAAATNSIYLPMLFNTGGPSQVSLKNISYIPNAITVKVGTQVVWTNNESSPIEHTVTSGTPGSPSGVFDSGFLNIGQSFSFTFSAPGTYNYYCRIHLAAMTGTVTVTP